MVYPSASFGEQGTRLYEPIHGSAPDIANQDKANPFGMVLSLALCLKESLNQEQAAIELENMYLNSLSLAILQQI